MASAEEAIGNITTSKHAAAVLDWALNFASVSETYQVHSWMILLGILRHENCTAAKVLKDLGLEDLYGAWHEVLWALRVSDGMEPKPFTPEIDLADRAYWVLVGSTNFAAFNGREKVQSEDLLMALAAGGVLVGLFPDLPLSFSNVRKAVEKHAGGKYLLPDDDEEVVEAEALSSSDDVGL